MKVRKGFVSNSSSSSFILSIGKVTDKRKAEEYLKNKKIDENKYVFIDKNNWEEIQKLYKYSFSCYWSGVYFSTDILDEEFQTNPDVIYICKIGYGPKDDNFFWDEELGYCDYDKIDITDFNKIDQEFYYDKIKGVDVIFTDYGAGRDG